MKRKSKRCSTGHGTGVNMPRPLRAVLDDKRRLGWTRTGAVLSQRDEALRALHRLAGGIGQKLRALLRNHRGRWPLA